MINFKNCEVKNNKVYHGNKVAVLVSAGYGAGWYSWNTNFKDCLTNPELIKLVLEKEALEEDLRKIPWDRRENSQIGKNLTTNVSNIENFANSLYGNEFYSGGAPGLYIEWIEEGSYFQITDYDGNESLKYKDSENWLSV